MKTFIKNYLALESAMQLIPYDQTVGSDTVNDLKDFNSQSLRTQAKKGEELVSSMPAFKKPLHLMGDGIVNLSMEKKTFKNSQRHYDKKWLEESKTKLLKQIDDEKRANLIMS